MSTTFSISAVMCLSGSLMNCGGSEEQRGKKSGSKALGCEAAAVYSCDLLGCLTKWKTGAAFVMKTVFRDDFKGTDQTGGGQTLTAPCPLNRITTFRNIKVFGMKVTFSTDSCSTFKCINGIWDFTAEPFPGTEARLPLFTSITQRLFSHSCKRCAHT